MRIVLGIVAILVGVAVAVAGAVAIFAEQAVRSLDTEVEGRIPQTLRFEAEDATYGIVLFVNATEQDVLDTHCEVALADGSRRSIAGDTQAFAVSGAQRSVGEFDAVAGATEVACRFEGRGEGASQRFGVAEIRTGLRTFGVAVVVVGLLILLAGVALMVAALTGRR